MRSVKRCERNRGSRGCLQGHERPASPHHHWQRRREQQHDGQRVVMLTRVDQEDVRELQRRHSERESHVRRPRPAVTALIGRLTMWPLLGLVAGVGLETKDTIIALLGIFVLGLLALGPRHVLRERRAWLAAAIALACLAPYLGWQIAHGWPSVAFLPTQAAATAAANPPLT